MIRKKQEETFFEDNTFDWHTWATHIIQTPTELREAFGKLNLVGKRIVNVLSVGGAHNLAGDYVDELLYREAKKSGEPERYGADINFYYNPDFTIPRWVQIDDPFIVLFEDGEQLEVDFSEGSSVVLNKNIIPGDITPIGTWRNFSGEKYFSPCIGKKLLGIDVKVTSEMPPFTGSSGISIDENASEYIKCFDLLLEGNMKIRFEPDYDYGEVTLLNGDDTPIEISFMEMDDCVDDMSRLFMQHNYRGLRNVGTSLRSYGLGEIIDDNKKCLDLIRTTCSRPIILHGYICQYLYSNYDFAEIAVTTMHRISFGPYYYNDDSIMGFNVHKKGKCFWRLFVGTQGKINVDERNPYFFTVMFKDGNGDGTLPINIIHADVVPSFLEDDYIVMQMVAFASSVEYIENEISEDLIPLGLVDSDNSPLVRIKGSVFEVAKRKVSMIGQEVEFLDVIVRTPYGIIELVHTLDMVKPEQHNLIEKGNFYDAVCVLSGDVAIGEYQNGAIRDEKNFSRLMRSCFAEGDFSRLCGVLSEKCCFMNEDESVASGREQVLKYLKEQYGGKTIRTCLITIYKDGGRYHAVEVMTSKPFILSVDVNNAEIERIKASYDMSVKQPPIDSIEFEVFEEGPYEGYMHFILSHRAKFVRTLINGRPLLEYVHECERRIYVDRKPIDYMYQFADDLYRYLTDKEYRVDDEICLLICGGCLVDLCEPIYVRMDEGSDVITWSDFYNIHTCYDSSDEHIKPFDIGPFHFRRDEFEKAVRELGEQIREDKE